MPHDRACPDGNGRPPARAPYRATMKLTSARLLPALLLLAVLILGTLLVWVASTAQTGWATLGLSWYNALLAPVGLSAPDKKLYT